VGLALAKLARRSTLRMPGWETAQLVSGLAIPVLLVDHMVAMRGASSLLGTLDFYRPSLLAMWPEHALRQSALLLLVWTHAIIGLHHWLRLASAPAILRSLLAALAVLLPALALAGFVAAGRETGAAFADAAAAGRLLASHRWPDAAEAAWLGQITTWILGIYAAAFLVAAAFPAFRMLAERRAPRIAVTYVGGPAIAGTVGATLLEMGRHAGVPHASVCGGRARCSTCRVRVVAGGASLPPPAFAEAVTLGAVGAPEGVRLACQIRPREPLTVIRLVTPGDEGRHMKPGSMEDDAAGIERHLAVMFLDIKGFTAMSDHRLPYDVVFLLNRFFGVIGAAITAEGGWIDKYMGDGLLAVFGRETGMRQGARAALAAARRIDRALDDLDAELGAEGLPRVGIGIGIHTGPMVMGRIGYTESAAITVIGAAVNTASRLEGLTREKGCQLVVSREAATAAGWRASGIAAEPVMVRGIAEPVEVLLVPRGRDVSLDDETTAA
jgi:adenylate cyclase